MKILEKIRQRIKGWKVNNRYIGWLIEKTGFCPRVDGVRLSLATPALSRGHKSTIAFGYHEMAERRMIRKHLRTDLPVIELGGGLGAVSCLINRALVRPSQHIVLECNPIMVEILNRNRAINSCSFRIIEKAIAYNADSVSLQLDSAFVGSTVTYGSTEDKNTIIVPACTLQDVIDPSFREFCLVADIEGMEYNLIQHEMQFLRDRCIQIIMETHERYVEAEIHTEMVRTLSDNDFTKVDEDTHVEVWQRK